MSDQPAAMIIRTVDDEVYLWPDNDRSIHLKAVTKFGDPVEMTGSQARELAAALIKLAELIGE